MNSTIKSATIFIYDVVKIPLCVYLLTVLGMILFQRHFEYIPDKHVFNALEFGVSRPFEPVVVKVDGGLDITSWYYPARDTHKPTIVFMHGNSGHFKLRSYRIKPWLAEGYGLVLVGYPGFDGNSGTPAEQTIYQSARGAIHNLNQRGISSTHIILHGESLGTTIAVQMASEFPVAALSLEAPPTAMADFLTWHYHYFITRSMVWDKLDSIEKIARVHSPLLLIHGEIDDIVPIEQGQALFAAANEPKEALFVPAAGHGYGLYTEPVNQKLLEFFSRFTH